MMLPLTIPETQPPLLKGRPEPEFGKPWSCAHCGEVTDFCSVWIKRDHGRKRKLGLCSDCVEACGLDEALGRDEYGLPSCHICKAEMTEEDWRIARQHDDFECRDCRGIEGVDWADQEAD